ncbi:MAG: ethanolamine ammonia-lyase reactivating factor EutA [Lachnospiraceae bacterium]|nr:ethanolamine ammonia-lyase reactivating factor EutA [Lachnospiraceae bacterium]
MESIISVGIDVGTTTTQVVFSRLFMENTAGIYNVPKVSITGKEILYRSEPFFTPLLDREHIDAEKVKGIVLSVYRDAGISPDDVSSGAVIITGESARKENAENIVRTLSGMAGEFVVSAAGPDMESVIAGKGSGAYAYSKDHHLRVVNLDIGGGTTNAVLFNRGRTMDTGCIDVGGRLIRTAPDGTVTGYSKAAKLVAEDIGADLAEGMRDEAVLMAIARRQASLLAEMTGLKERSSLYKKLLTPDSSGFDIAAAPDVLCYSGGVADAVRGKYDSGDSYRFGDIGILLGRAIREDPYLNSVRRIEADNTISATVIGAGSYTTTVSGSTIRAEADLLPMKNLTVYRVTEAEQEKLFAGDGADFAENLFRYMELNGQDVAVALRGKPDPSYPEVKRLAAAMAASAEACLAPGRPLVLVFENDMAKVFGMCFLQVSDRRLVSIDGIPVQSADHIDIGRPIVGGLVVPVVIKTLLFGH